MLSYTASVSKDCKHIGANSMQMRDYVKGKEIRSDNAHGMRDNRHWNMKKHG